MKPVIFLLCLFLPVIIFSQTLQQESFKKLNPKFLTVLEPFTGKSLKKSAPSVPLISPAGKLSSGENIYEAIVYTTQPDALIAAGVKPNSILPGFVTARLSAGDLVKLANLDQVKYIDAPGTEYPMNDVSKGLIGADLLHNGYINSTPYKGNGVIVAIIDTGIDWAHPDFRDPNDQTKSRILYIWDQTLTTLVGAEHNPSDFNYGAEYTKADIEDEIDTSPAGFVREKDTNGHGTHVAGSAAGNGAAQTTRNYGGVAPEADLIIVKAGNGSFSTNNIVNALTYIKNKATELGKPVVVNMSLGSNAGPHDGTDPKSIAIDNFTGSGRVVVVSAGNDGDSPIHVSGTIPAGGYTDLSITVPVYTATAGANNDYFAFDAYLADNSAANISVTSPGTFSAVQNFGSYSYNSTDEGNILLDSEVDPANNNTELFVEVYDSVESKPPKNGTWTIRFSNPTGTEESFHGWLYNYSTGDAAVTLNGGNSNYTLGNWANSAIIVGSYVSRWFWSASGGNFSYPGSDISDNISAFSSIGPTRDGRQKPDIAAPGQGIISARSSYVDPGTSWLMPGGFYFLTQGTSMASPITTGAVALLLQKSPDLTADDAKSLITSTAMHDSYTGSATLPDYTWGYGKLDIFKAMTKLYNPGLSFSRDIIVQDHFTGTAGLTITAGTKTAVKFIPSNTGRLSGVFIHPRNISALTSPIIMELWSDNGSGLPGTKICDLTSWDYTKIASFSFNYLNLLSANVTVTKDVTYYIVFYFNSSGPASFGFDNGTVSGTTFSDPGTGWASYSADCRVRPVIVQDVTALPVELTAFSASPGKNSVMLQWSTATEINSYMFEIERLCKSDDGKSLWQKAGSVNAAGNSNSPRDYSYEDCSLPSGSYDYRLKMIDNDGSFKYSEIVTAEVLNPLAMELMQNFPNPFNPVTKISYAIASDVHVKLKVYDILGSEVATLKDEIQPAGSYSVYFDAGRLAAGVYIYKMEAGSFVQARKFVLVK